MAFVSVGLGGAQWPSKRKDVVHISGPADGRPAARRSPRWELTGLGKPSDRVRFAKRASRGALDARPAQGRVGVFSRQIAELLAHHPLLLARASARTDPFAAVVLRALDPARRLRPSGPASARREARSKSRLTRTDIHRSPCDALARPRFACVQPHGSRPSRGKGVLAA
jgi:hypothetical protein